MTKTLALAGLLLLPLSGASRAETVTVVITMPAEVCQSPRLAKRGDDLYVRCTNKPADEHAFKITNYPKSCPNPKATKDAAGNLLIRCP
jgi:hypothetical protein